MGVRDWLRRKATSGAGRNRADPTTAIAMVALRRSELPDEHRILGVLREQWNDLPAIAGVEREGDIVSVRVLGGIAGLVLMPAPIPWSDLEWPARAVAWNWPEAEVQMREHQAHVIVHVTSSELDRVDVWLLLTRLIAALVAVSDTAGIYWGNASVVHEPTSFVEQARDASRDNLPMLLWLGYHPVRTAAGVSAYTTGLETFGHLDLEIENSSREPSEVLGRLADMAHYLVSTGAIFKDGDTVGSSESERIRVRHVRSAFGDRTVCRIEM